MAAHKKWKKKVQQVVSVVSGWKLTSNFWSSNSKFVLRFQLSKEKYLDICDTKGWSNFSTELLLVLSFFQAMLVSTDFTSVWSHILIVQPKLHLHFFYVYFSILSIFVLTSPYILLYTNKCIYFPNHFFSESSDICLF